jgi:hypothetical protein
MKTEKKVIQKAQVIPEIVRFNIELDQEEMDTLTFMADRARHDRRALATLTSGPPYNTSRYMPYNSETKDRMAKVTNSLINLSGLRADDRGCYETGVEKVEPVRVDPVSPSSAPADTFESVLDTVVKFLNRSNDDSLKLWNILTALRGPDTEDPLEELKRATTSVIRTKIGILPCANGATTVPDDSEELVKARMDYVQARTKHTYSYHFGNHAMNAFHSLGLRWDTLNKLKLDKL